jgi:hypothetical protein
MQEGKQRILGREAMQTTQLSHVQLKNCSAGCNHHLQANRHALRNTQRSQPVIRSSTVAAAQRYRFNEAECFEHFVFLSDATAPQSPQKRQASRAQIWFT